MAITRAESQRTDQIVQDLEERHQVIVSRDWGEAREWRGGYWSLSDLRALQAAVTDLAGAMGGAETFADNIGRVTVGRARIKFRGLAFRSKVLFAAASALDKWTIVHELGHVWDARTGCKLSRTLQVYTGGRSSRLAMLIKKLRRQYDEQHRWPGCNRSGYFYAGVPPAGSDRNFNRREDFAESVAAYVYPSEAHSRVERFKDDDSYSRFLYYSDYAQTKRWAFVDGLVRPR